MLPLPELAFVGAVLLAGYLTVRCITPPHATPSDAWKNDDLRIYASTGFVNLIRLLVASIFIQHALIAYYTSSSTLPAAVCPNASVLNAALFRWTPLTAVCLGSVILLGGPLRLGAFSGLGKSFTFGLAKPDALVTDGIYAYIQHPSYTGLMVVVSAGLAMIYRGDAGLGCWAPAAAGEIWRSWGLVLYGLAHLVMVQQVWVRVAQEEAMLKEVFGREWVDWHSVTKRFVPGVV